MLLLLTRNDCCNPERGLSSQPVARRLTIKPYRQCHNFCLANCGIATSYYTNVVCLGSILDRMGALFRGETSELQPDFHLCQFDRSPGLFEQSSKQDNASGCRKSASNRIDTTSGRIVYCSGEWRFVSLITR